MRLIQSSIIRSVVAIVIGILLVKYRLETMTWITIAAGIMFFISGIISCLVYYFEREKILKTSPLSDNKDSTENSAKPIFPIVGIGCAVLGIILTLMPNQFITWVVYIFAAILILGAINQFTNLIGWCLMFYGVVELINTIKINQMKRAYNKIEDSKVVNGVEMPTNENIEDADIIND